MYSFNFERIFFKVRIGLIKLIVALGGAVPFAFMYDGAWAVLAVAIAFVCSYIAVNILFWLITIALAVISGFGKNEKKNSRFFAFWLNTAITEVCWLARIKVNAIGMEKLPNVPYLLVCNHRSNFDNFVITSVLRDPMLVFISKPSNFRIPFAGRLIKRCGYLAIDRENPRNALKTIHTSADLIKTENMSVAVFPEGTRGREDGVAEFSEGCFLIAKKAACPVVVTSLTETDKIHSRFPFKTKVRFEIVDIISAEDVKAKRSGELSEIAHKLITDSYLANRTV